MQQKKEAIWKPLNVITLEQTEGNNINGMITISSLLLIQLA
jgi:hypothetical protein